MAIAPIPSSSAGPAAPAQHPSDIDTALQQALDSDPKLALRKRLVDELFVNKNDDGKDAPESPRLRDAPPHDTVTISTQALEIRQRQTIDVQVATAEGSVTVHYRHEEALRVETQRTQPASADPLVVDIDKDGIELTDALAGAATPFDINGDGRTERVSWVRPHDGFLAYDKNGNGRIDNGTELFGDQNGAADGFAELSRYDADTNGAIDSRDPIFGKLRIWRDLNQNGASDAGELTTLTELGITSIGLTARHSTATAAGNRIAAYAAYDAAGRTGTVGEVLLNYAA